MNIYYVYMYLREDGTPYYIGKGKEKRAYSKCRSVMPPVDESRIQFVARNLIEFEAFLLEIKLIKIYGRKDCGTGILHNRTNGGDGTSGTIWSDQSKLAVSKAKTDWHKKHDISGSNNPMYGKKHAQSVCDASYERALEHGFIGNRKGKDPWNKGIKLGSRGPNKKPRAKVSCIHCGILVAPHILSRFHGDKCNLSV
jgi:hypothetical protein